MGMAPPTGSGKGRVVPAHAAYDRVSQIGV